MNAKTLLRVLVISELLLIALDFGIGFFGLESLPESLQAYEDARFEGGLTATEWFGVAIGLLMLLATPIASIGLIFFWRPARPLYAATIAATFLLVALLGPYISSTILEVTDYISTIISGVVLAMIYLPPCKEYFEENEVVKADYA